MVGSLDACQMTKLKKQKQLWITDDEGLEEEYRVKIPRLSSFSPEKISAIDQYQHELKD